MRHRSREQELVDILFQLTITAATNDCFRGKSIQEIAEWTAGQLRANGFPTEPCGACWGVLVEPDRKPSPLNMAIEIISANRPD
jgi:hypothetical protein